MILHLGLICALFTSSFAYSNQDSSNIAIELDEDYDYDYSDIEEDLKLLEEEDRLHS